MLIRSIISFSVGACFLIYELQLSMRNPLQQSLTRGSEFGVKTSQCLSSSTIHHLILPSKVLLRWNETGMWNKKQKQPMYIRISRIAKSRSCGDFLSSLLVLPLICTSTVNRELDNSTRTFGPYYEKNPCVCVFGPQFQLRICACEAQRTSRGNS